MKKLYIFIMLLTILGIQGCGDSNVSRIKESTFTDFPNTTIGEAFGATFDSPQWAGEKGNKGTNYVVFTGKVSRKMHDRLLKVWLPAKYHDEQTLNSSDSLAECLKNIYIIVGGRLPEGYYKPLLDSYWEALSEKSYDKLLAQFAQDIRDGKVDGKGKPIFESDVKNTKEYLEHTKERKKIKDEFALQFQKELFSALEKHFWPVGEEVSFKWAISADGTRFDLVEFSTPNSVTLNMFLKEIYRE